MRCCSGQERLPGSSGCPHRRFVLGIGRVLSSPSRPPQATVDTSSLPSSGVSSLRESSETANRSSTSSMPVCHRVSREGTLKDRLLRCGRFDRGTESFQTLGLASISSEQACSTYWTSRSPADSATLWLPTETGLLDLDSNLSSTSSRVTEPWLQCCTLQRSALLTEDPLSSRRTCLRSLRFSPQDIMVGEATQEDEEEEEEKTPRRCRKIRIFPTTQQIKVFNQMAGASRYLYNKANETVIKMMKEARTLRLAALETMKASDPQPRCCHHTFPPPKTKGGARPPPHRCENARTEPNADREGEDEDPGHEWFCGEHKETGTLGISYSHFLSLSKLRPLVMASDKDIPDDAPDAWLKKIPYDTRQGAVKELVGAYKSAFALKRGGHIKKFQMHFKRKKAVRQVFHCRANAFDPEDRVIFRTRLGKKGGKLRTRRSDLSKLLGRHDEDEKHGDFVIQKTRPGAWYICLPRKVKADRTPVFETAPYKSVFVDPGVRSFGSLYSPDGICGKVGDRFCERFLDKLAKKVHKLTSLYSSRKGPDGRRLKARTVRNLKRRCQILRNKIKHKVDDLHWKTCTFMTTAFQKIFIPQFGIKEMVKKKSRRGRKRVIGCETTRRMLELAHGRFLERLKYCARIKCREVYIVPESFTTMTCGACGVQNRSVGGSHTFKCQTCGYKMDRDLHGARNICLSTMSRMRGG